MKKSYYINILMMLLFTSLTIVVGCKEDDDVNDGKAKLLSFGPTGASHGDTLVFIGENLKKVESIQLQGATLPSSSFIDWTSESLKIIIPEEAYEGKVTLNTKDGALESKTVLSFNVPISIISVTEEARPGAEVTVKGQYLNWIEAVIFGEDTVRDFISQSLNELVVTVPLTAKTGQLTFLGGGTEPVTVKTEQDLLVTLPAVTALSPSSAIHTGKLTVSGSNLDLITSIVFAGNKTVSTFVSKTEGEIVVEVPVGALKGKLTLKQPSGVDVITESELIIILPAGTNLSPKPAKPGVDNITILGTNLDLVAKLKLAGVTDSISSSSFTKHTATEISLALPASATAGPIAYETIHGYKSNLGVTVTLPGAGPTPLPVSLYEEQIAPGGGDWSWEKVVSDMASTEQFYMGNVSWKFQTNNGGGMSSGGITPLDVSNMTYFTFSLYGGPGTEGKDVACILNDKWDSYNSVKLVEGKWTTYQIALSQYSTVDKTAIVRFAFKVEGMTASTIFADRVGFE
jgi:hypothetical protein